MRVTLSNPHPVREVVVHELSGRPRRVGPGGTVTVDISAFTLTLVESLLDTTIIDEPEENQSNGVRSPAELLEAIENGEEFANIEGEVRAALGDDAPRRLTKTRAVRMLEGLLEG